MVGVAERESKILSVKHATRIVAVVILIHHSRHVHGLSRAIYASVGIERRACHLRLVVVIIEATCHRRTREGAFLICIYAVSHGIGASVFEDRLSVGVARKRLHFMVLTVLVHRHHHVHLGVRHGCSCRGVEHHEACLVARQRLHHGIDIAYAEQTSLHGYADVVRRHLHKIHARTQSAYLQRVAQCAVSRLSDVSAYVRIRLFVRYDMAAQTCIVGVHVGIELCSAVNVQSAHSQLQLAHVVHSHHHHLARHVRKRQLASKRGMEGRKRQAALCVAQDVHARPCSPLHEGIVDVVHLVVLRHVLRALHVGISLYCHLATNHEVGIFMHERVERHDELRLLHSALVAVLTVVANNLQSCEACCLALAVRSIIVVHAAIVFGTHSDYVEHVVIEVFRVVAVLHERVIARAVSLCQLVRTGHRLGVIFLREARGILHGSLVIGIHLAENRLINGCQNLVATCHSRLFVLPDAINLCIKRVIRDINGILRRQHLRLQQLSVGAFALRLFGNLTQHLKDSLGMILSPCCVIFLPKRRI